MSGLPEGSADGAQSSGGDSQLVAGDASAQPRGARRRRSGGGPAAVSAPRGLRSPGRSGVRSRTARAGASVRHPRRRARARERHGGRRPEVQERKRRCECWISTATSSRSAGAATWKDSHEPSMSALTRSARWQRSDRTRAVRCGYLRITMWPPAIAVPGSASSAAPSGLSYTTCPAGSASFTGRKETLPTTHSLTIHGEPVSWPSAVRCCAPRTTRCSDDVRTRFPLSHRATRRPDAGRQPPRRIRQSPSVRRSDRASI